MSFLYVLVMNDCVAAANPSPVVAHLGVLEPVIDGVEGGRAFFSRASDSTEDTVSYEVVDRAR